MPGSNLAAILIPIAGPICLIVWLALVFRAGRDPRPPTAARRQATEGSARPIGRAPDPGQRSPAALSPVVPRQVKPARSSAAAGTAEPGIAAAPCRAVDEHARSRYFDRGPADSPDAVVSTSPSGSAAAPITG
jgi:hypothetical protein